MTQRMTQAQAILNLIDNIRRLGSSHVLLDDPRVASGEVLFVAGSRDELNYFQTICPNLRGVTIHELAEGKCDPQKGPAVIDLSAVYSALLEASKGNRDRDIYPYEVVNSGMSREVRAVRDGNGKVQSIEPVPGSEKAWVDLYARRHCPSGERPLHFRA